MSRCCCRVRLPEEVRCAPQLLFTAFAPVGSFPTISTDILGGPFVVPVLPFSPYAMTLHPPRVDLLVTNPSSLCSFDLALTIDGPAGSGVLEPGAEVQIGSVGRFGAVNAPLDVTPLSPADLYAAQYYRENVTGTAESFSDGTGTKDQLRVIGPFGVPVLGPGDFVWASIQTLVATAGFTGVSFYGQPTGYGIQVEGIRV